jgi:hypothetical protein
LVQRAVLVLLLVLAGHLSVHCLLLLLPGVLLLLRCLIFCCCLTVQGTLRHTKMKAAVSAAADLCQVRTEQAKNANWL